MTRDHLFFRRSLAYYGACTARLEVNAYILINCESRATRSYRCIRLHCALGYIVNATVVLLISYSIFLATSQRHIAVSVSDVHESVNLWISILKCSFENLEYLLIKIFEIIYYLNFKLPINLRFSEFLRLYIYIYIEFMNSYRCLYSFLEC